MLLTYPAHDSFYRYMCGLNALYLSHAAFYEGDYARSGFFWIDCHQEEKCLYAISRKSKAGELIALFNFGEQPQRYALPEPYGQREHTVLLNTEWERYGGKKPVEKKASSAVTLERFSGILLLANKEGKEVPKGKTKP